MTLHEQYADVQLQTSEVYRILIPNLKPFTEKLEGLQRDMNIDVVDHIPIKVYENSPLGQALITLSGPLITIAIFLAIFSFTRRAAGGGDSVYFFSFFLFIFSIFFLIYFLLKTWKIIN